MSSYTYVILTCSHIDTFGDYGFSLLEPILEKQGLPFLEDSSTEITVYTMCGNYLPMSTLIEAIESVPWERSEQVQLFHKHESADRYEEVSLKLKRVEYDHYIEWVPDENGPQFDEFSQTRGAWHGRHRVKIRESHCDESEDAILAASGVLQQLVDRALQEPPSPDWERELDAP